MDDIEAIKQLKARYFRTLDTKDWGAFSDVFTDDFVSDTSEAGGTVVEGKTAFIDYVKKNIGNSITVHHGHMPEIEITSATTAAGYWAMEDLVRFGWIELHGFGHYTETYEKIADKWYIKSSKLTRLRENIQTAFFSILVSERMRSWMQKAAARRA